MGTDVRPKAIYLCGKSEPEEQIKEAVDRSAKIFPRYQWTTARAFFAEKIGTAGGWSEWEAMVVRTFDFFTVGTLTLGKATAAMIDQALDSSKSVVYLGHDNEVQYASAVLTVDAKNWKAGWQLALAEPEIEPSPLDAL